MVGVVGRVGVGVFLRSMIMPQKKNQKKKQLFLLSVIKLEIETSQKAKL